MIKVNLLKNKAVVAEVGAAASSENSPGLSNLGFPAKTTSLDSGFDTFECSPVAQVIKLLLLVGFIVPLVAYEKMQANSSKSIISSKNVELQSYQAIKSDKELVLSALTGLDVKKEKMKVRDIELQEIKNNRLTALYGIDELQTTVPGDVWLTSVNFKGGDRIDISGQTLLDSGLDRLVAALKESPRLSKINVQQDIPVKSTSGRTLNEFKITMSVTKGISETNQIDEIEGL